MTLAALSHGAAPRSGGHPVSIGEPERILPRPAGGLPARVPGNGADHDPADRAQGRIPGPPPTRPAGDPQLTPGPGHAGQTRRFPGPIRHPVAAALLCGGLLAVVVVPPPRPAARTAVHRPVYLSIPVIGVRARLIRLGLTARGILQVPASTSVAGWYTGSPGRARSAPRSSPATSTPTAGRGCSSGCASCGPVTGSMSSTPTARWRRSASTPSTHLCQGPFPDTEGVRARPRPGTAPHHLRRGVRSGARLIPEQHRRLRRPDPLTGSPGLRIPGRYLESRSAPTPLGNGRPVCAGIWTPLSKRPVTESPGAKVPCPSQTRAHHRTGCPGPSGLRILIGSSPERTGSSVREIPEVHA